MPAASSIVGFCCCASVVFSCRSRTVTTFIFGNESRQVEDYQSSEAVYNAWIGAGRRWKTDTISGSVSGERYASSSSSCPSGTLNQTNEYSYSGSVVLFYNPIDEGFAQTGSFESVLYSCNYTTDDPPIEECNTTTRNTPPSTLLTPPASSLPTTSYTLTTETLTYSGCRTLGLGPYEHVTHDGSIVFTLSDEDTIDDAWARVVDAEPDVWTGTSCTASTGNYIDAYANRRALQQYIQTTIVQVVITVTGAPLTTYTVKVYHTDGVDTVSCVTDSSGECLFYHLIPAPNPGGSRTVTDVKVF